LSLVHCLVEHQKDCGPLSNGTTSTVAPTVCTGRDTRPCLRCQSHHQTRRKSTLAQRVRMLAHAVPKMRTMAKPRCADPIQALAARALARTCRQPFRTPYQRCVIRRLPFFCFVLESAQLACRVQPERAQVEAQYWGNVKVARLEGNPRKSCIIVVCACSRHALDF